MTIGRGIAIIVSSTVVCGIAGLLLGYALARVAPGYYRHTFRSTALTPEFEILELAVGLGLTQGVIAGLSVGCVLVLAVTLYSFRNTPSASAKE